MKILDKIIEINELKNRKMKKSFIRKGAAIFALALALNGPVGSAYVDNNVAVVEAATKKDKKKPKVTLKGKKKLTVEEGKKVTIPKTTYSDNKTKKSKLKVDVTVKKGKKSFKTIAKQIKKATLKSKTVKVLFPEEGKYTITYTVKDQAKNKKTAKRTVVVNPKVVNAEPVSPATPTPQQVITTEAPVVEQPTTEEVVTTEEKVPDWIIDVTDTEYVDYNYPIVSSTNPAPYDLSTDNEAYDVTITFEHDYKYLCVDRNDPAVINGDIIKYLGKITAIDSNGNDVSDTIVIGGLEFMQKYIAYPDSDEFTLTICAKNANGNNVGKKLKICFIDLENISNFPYLLNDNPKVYGRMQDFSLNNDLNLGKKLIYKNYNA